MGFPALILPFLSSVIGIPSWRPVKMPSYGLETYVFLFLSSQKGSLALLASFFFFVAAYVAVRVEVQSVSSFSQWYLFRLMSCYYLNVSCKSLMRGRVDKVTSQTLFLGFFSVPEFLCLFLLGPSTLTLLQILFSNAPLESPKSCTALFIFRRFIQIAVPPSFCLIVVPQFID